MQYHHTAKVRRRRTVVGIVLWLAAFTIAMSTPLFSGGLLLAVLLLLLGLATILEANHAS